MVAFSFMEKGADSTISCNETKVDKLVGSRQEFNFIFVWLVTLFTSHCCNTTFQKHATKNALSQGYLPRLFFSPIWASHLLLFLPLSSYPSSSRWASVFETFSDTHPEATSRISVPYSYRRCTVFAICLGLPHGVYVWMNAQVPKEASKGSIFKNLKMDDSYQPGASAHVGKGLAHQGVPREMFFSNPGPGVTAPSDQGLFIHRACHTEVGVFTYSLSSGCAVSAFWLCPYCSTSNWGVLPVFNWVLSIFSGDVCCFSQDFCKFFFFFNSKRTRSIPGEGFGFISDLS